MAQFVSSIDGVIHHEKDVSIANYPVPTTLVLTRSFMQTLVSCSYQVLALQNHVNYELLDTVDFGVNHLPNPVIISSSGSGIPGKNYSLACSATLVDPTPLPSNIPTPNFEWFFGPNGNASLPSGVTPMVTTLGSGYVYTSSLQFSVLIESHAGKYTCQLGVGVLANSTTVIVKGKMLQHFCIIINLAIISNSFFSST